MKTNEIVLHVETSTFGRVVRVLEPGEHKDPDGNAIDERVVELVTGDRFLAKEGAFVVLSGEELGLAAQIEDELRTLLLGAAFVLQKVGSPRDRALLIARAVLARQLRALAPGGDAQASDVSSPA